MPDLLLTPLMILLVILIFNLMIVVHELGHFLAARLVGAKADRFAIWFGKPIWKKKIGGVTYQLGWIPFGGFVSIPQMAPMEAIEGSADLTAEEKQNLPPLRPWPKIIVAFAGPLFSFLLAFAFAILVWAVGKPVDESEGPASTTIGYVKKDSPAAQAGLRPGDRILAVDGKPVTRYSGMLPDAISWNIIVSEDEKINFRIQRDGQQIEIPVTPNQPEKESFKRGGFREVDIAPAEAVIVGAFVKNSPAEAAGLHTGDHIVTLDGQPVQSRGALSDYIQDRGTQPIAFGILRDDQPITVTVTPEIPIKGQEPGKERPMIGISYAQHKWASIAHPSPIAQIRDSVTTIVQTLKTVFSAKSSVGAQHLSGPVGIGNTYYTLLTIDQGWRLVLWFSVILNVNLAMMNLLPIPVLDGGHIAMALWEQIFRRPMNLRFLEYVQSACVLFLLGFMLFVTFYDVQDLGGRGPKSAPASTDEIVFKTR